MIRLEHIEIKTYMLYFCSKGKDLRGDDYVGRKKLCRKTKGTVIKAPLSFLPGTEGDW